MDDYDNYNDEILDDIDQLDELSDDKLWDILDNYSVSEKTSETVIEKLDKYDQSCGSCQSKNIIFAHGRSSFVCTDCGTESREILDDSPEWNNYEDGKADNGRCGAPISAFFPKSSLGTTINAPGYSKVKMLRNWGQVPYKERSLGEVLNDIDAKCKKYKITKAVIDNAKILYKNIRETKHTSGYNKGKNVIIRGINRKQIIAACFYFGAVLQKSPRSVKEVADIFDLELKQVTKGCRKFLETMKDNFIVFDIKPSHGSDFIERFGFKIKLSKEIITLAKTISDNTTTLYIASDHQAISIAAASILLAANILEFTINKKSISEIFNISDVTITKTYKKIYPYQKIVISDELTNKIYHKMNIKFMSDGLENEEVLNLDEEDKELSEKSEQLESETDILIKKLNLNNGDLTESEDMEPIEVDTELDESDIIKKDNSQSKKNKYILIQQEKEQRKLEKMKLKEEKERLKSLGKKDKKEKKEKIIILGVENSDGLLEGIKKKRGRPRKVQQLVSNI